MTDIANRAAFLPPKPALTVDLCATIIPKCLRTVCAYVLYFGGRTSAWTVKIAGRRFQFTTTPTSYVYLFQRIEKAMLKMEEEFQNSKSITNRICFFLSALLCRLIMQDTLVVVYVVTFHELRNKCVCVPAETGGAKNMLSP